MEEYLIKNTTREQREEIVKKSLGYSDIGCDEYMDGYDMYEPYINGEKEISEITQSFKATYISEDLRDCNGGRCNGR